MNKQTPHTMRQILYIVTLLTATPVMAQEDTLKTDSATTLRELTVNGVRMEQKTGRRLLFPSKTMKEHSTDGYDLLKRLRIPDIRINILEHTITSIHKGDVQVRINDVKASAEDIQALRPDEIIRVEYIDNPGARYSEDNLDAVINYVVRQRYSGYQAGANVLQAFTTGFNNSSTYFNYNHKKSEYSFKYSLNHRKYDKQKVNSSSTYLFPDGTTRERNYLGFYNKMAYTDQTFQGGYSLAEPDKYLLNIRLTYAYYRQPYKNPAQRAVESGQPDRLFMTYLSNVTRSPSLDIYYSVNLPHAQTVTANVVGTYINSGRGYAMHEYLFDNSLDETLLHQPTNDYSYSTKGRKYSLISEAIYTKNFKRIVLSAGVNYTTSHTNNHYTGSVNTNAVLNSNNLYAFTQIEGKLGIFNYQLGMGANYASIKQGATGFSKWTFRPQLTLSTNAIPNVSLRYNGRITPRIPSLADLSNIRQQSNDLQATDGNPDLVPYNNYRNTLSATWTRPLFDFEVSGMWMYIPHIIMDAITPLRQTDGSWLLSWKPENMKRYTYYYTGANLTLHVLKNKLDVTVFGNWNRYENRGNSFSHNYTYWGYGASASLMLGKWTLDYDYAIADKWMDSETVYQGENSSVLTLSYKYKNLRMAAGCLLPGCPKGYEYINDTNSRYYRGISRTTIKNNGNMLFFNVSYTFSHGQTFKAAERKLNNSDRDNGIK